MSIISNSHQFCFVNTNRVGAKTVKTILSGEVGDLSITVPSQMTIEKTLLIREKVADYFKFAYVRNPYDIVVSLYFHINQNGNDDCEHVSTLSFYEFIEWLRDYGMKRNDNEHRPIYKTQTEYLYVDGKLAVDKIFYYEELIDDMQTSNVHTLCENLGIQSPSQVPILNKSERPIVWNDMYNIRSYKLVNEIFAEDFKNFNYKMYGQ